MNTNRRLRLKAPRPALLAGACLLSTAAVWSTPAAAWMSANRFGGASAHTWGASGHMNRWGGSTEHVAGVGTEHTNAWGGNTAHSFYGGTEHTNIYGGHTSGAAGYGAYHAPPGGAPIYRPPAYPAYPTYPAYHPPMAVPYYSSGCYGCAAAAGAVVGMATGAAIASASNAAATSNAYAAGVATGSANASAAYQSGYAAGTVAPAAGTTVTTVTTTNTAPANYVMGASYATLPGGSISVVRNGQTYYLHGNTWFLPAYGANGVHYTVVSTP